MLKQQYRHGPRPGGRVKAAPWHRLGAILVLGAVAFALSGCMEALSTSTGRADQRPAARPSPTAPQATATPATTGMSPTLPGSYAPDPATAAPTALPPTVPAAPAAPVPPTVAPLPPLALPTPATLTNEERWRAQQIDRQPFEAPRPFFSTGSELWWYDPLNQQHVILGRITGDFLGQATFTLRGQGVAAIEIPYQINVSYGLTAISPALLERINAAGYTEWIETYVFLTPDIIQR